jgi:hypothetical protein
LPVTYRIDRDLGLIETACTGMVTMEEVLAHFDVLARDPSRPASADVLLSLAGMTLPEAPQLRTVADRIGWKPGFGFRHCAIVADSAVLYGIGRMFAAHAGAHFAEVAVFRDRDEAAAWLAERRPG